MTVMIGANGAGKTAAFEGLLRLFGVTQEQRQVRAEDFHVPAREEEPPQSRDLAIEVVIAFPELEKEGSGSETVPEFFRQMAASEEPDLKCRFRIEAQWTADGTTEGVVTEMRRVIRTLDEDYGEEWSHLPVTDRRIQMIYVPAFRDGARHLTAFLRGRLWQAAKWSEHLRELVSQRTEELTTQFRAEPVVETVETALTRRWQELHRADTDANPSFRPVDKDFPQIVGKANLLFEPTETGHDRRADQLSDGQRSLLHIALTAATLDVEADIVTGSKDVGFDKTQARIPVLTILVIEEPENSLSPFFLSRIILQVQAIADKPQAQALISSHSASVLGRVDPTTVRHFRFDNTAGEASVKRIPLPSESEESSKYVREAVRAYPELYFARFAVLGEGSSEEIAFPLLAEACGVPIDRSFVAVVPLGGRHVNHFWRLLNDLGIPHATLLDLDRGRAGGGEGRIRTVCAHLIEAGKDPFDNVPGFHKLEDLKDFFDEDQFRMWVDALREHNVFFCEPLDLDMLLLEAFLNAYTELREEERGPTHVDASHAVLGDSGNPLVYPGQGWSSKLQWYRYLFLGRSKPSTHLRVLSGVSSEDLREKTPAVIKALVERVRDAVG